MRFRGAIETTNAAPARVVIAIDDGTLVLEADGRELGAWPLEDIEAERLDSERFAITLGGQPLIFAADDPIPLAYDGLKAIEEARARRRRWFRRRRPTPPPLIIRTTDLETDEVLEVNLTDDLRRTDRSPATGPPPEPEQAQPPQARPLQARPSQAEPVRGRPAPAPPEADDAVATPPPVAESTRPAPIEIPPTRHERARRVAATEPAQAEPIPPRPVKATPAAQTPPAAATSPEPAPRRARTHGPRSAAPAPDHAPPEGPRPDGGPADTEPNEHDRDAAPRPAPAPPPGAEHPAEGAPERPRRPEAAPPPPPPADDDPYAGLAAAATARRTAPTGTDGAPLAGPADPFRPSAPGAHRSAARRVGLLERFRARRAPVEEHVHTYAENRVAGGLLRRVCTTCGHVSIDLTDD